MSNDSLIVSLTWTEFDQIPKMTSLSNNDNISKLVMDIFENAHKNTFQLFELISEQYQH